jgi:phage repressor protein C with HTH and peptisase S24 domain
MIKLFRISGDSLYPLYKEGELVVGVRPKFGLHVRAKDIVTFTHKGVGVMIKQVRSIENSQVFVVGTSPDSVDSRVFGTISLDTITYKILFKVPLRFL